MTFNSVAFLIFYPLVLLGYFLCRKIGGKVGRNLCWVFLLAASYFFYMYTNTPCTAVFEIKNISEVDFVQYVNGKWVELKSTIDTDDTVTVEQVTEGPMAIFTK